MGPKIESELGFPRAQIQPLFHRVREGQKDYILSSEEKEMINKCLEACLKYIDAWEFPAVMDHSKEDVQRFYEEFKRDVHL